MSRGGAMVRGSTNDQMNLDQLMELKALFQRADRDGGGSLDLDEFMDAFGKVLGRNLTREQIRSLYMKIDANSDGSVDWDEFTNFMLLENQAASEMQEGACSVEFPEPSDMTGTPYAAAARSAHCHKDMIEKVLVIPGQDKVISSSHDGTMRAWHSGTLAHLKTIRVCGSWVTDTAYFQMSNRIAAACFDRTLAFYDASSYESVGSMPDLETSPLCLGSWNDGADERLAVGDDVGVVTVYATGSASDRETPQASLRVEKLTKLRRHTDWVTKVGDLERRARDAQSLGSPRVNGGAAGASSKELYGFDWSPSFKVLASCGLERSVSLWTPNTRTGKPSAFLAGHNASVCHVSFYDEQQMLISCSVDKTVKIWDMRMHRCLQTITDKTHYRPEDRLSAFAFDPHRAQLLTASSSIRPWPLLKRAGRDVHTGHDQSVIAALYNPNFHQVVTGDEAAQVCVWDLGTGGLSFHFSNCHAGKMTCMSFDGAGRRLLTGGNDGSVRVWNFSNGQCLRHLASGSPTEISSILFLTESQQKYIVAGGWNRKVIVWKDERHIGASACAPDRSLEGHTEDILSIAFLQPNLLATSGYDGALLIWNMDSGVVKHSFSAPDSATKEVDQRAIFHLLFLQQRTQALCGCGADGCLRFWSAKDGALLWAQHAGHRRGEALTRVATDPDNLLLYTADTAGFIKAWDISEFVAVPGLDQSKRLRELIHWRAHDGSVTSMEFIIRGDERFLLTSSNDHSVRMWAMDAKGRPSLAATFGQLPWTLADPASHTPVTPVRAGRASVRFGAGDPGGGSEAAEAPETVSGEVEEVATDPTGLAVFVESVEMGGEEGGEEEGEEEGGGGGLASPSSSRDLRTKAIIDNILARGKDARAGGGGGGGAAMLGGRGSLSHNPVMHRLKVHRLAEVKPRTPR